MARPAVPLATPKRESPYVDAQRPESSTRMGRGGRRVTRVAGIDGGPRRPLLTICVP